MSDEVAFPRFVSYLEPPEGPDLHLLVRYAIDARIDSLEALSLNTTSSCCSTGTGSVEQLLRSMRADRALLGEHWAVAGSNPSGPDQPVVSRACGLAQSCPHALELARKYGVKTPKARGTGRPRGATSGALGRALSVLRRYRDADPRRGAARGHLR